MTPLLIANWKSHKNEAQALAWLEIFAAFWSKYQGQSQVVIAPPASLLGSLDWFFREKIASTLPGQLSLGVQDLSPFPSGAYTGALSIENIANFQVKYAIVGHSERRRYFHETHAEVANKVDQALAAGITPVVCVDVDYVESQAAAIARDQLEKCVVAYEPLEAIGSGVNQPIIEVKPVVSAIKAAFGKVPILYGGSVSSQNVAEYTDVVDGFLVGSKSLDAQEWIEIIKKAGN